MVSRQLLENGQQTQKYNYSAVKQHEEGKGGCTGIVTGNVT